MNWQLTLLALLLACSFVVSGSETALFALSLQDRRSFAMSSRRSERLAARLMNNPRRVLMTVLIANTAVNVLIFAVSYVSFDKITHKNPAMAAVIGIATLVLVILLGEILPKTLALSHARAVAPVVSPVIRLLQLCTGPLQVLLHVALVEPITRLLKPDSDEPQTVTTEDLQALVELSAEQGIISSHERNMLHEAVALWEIRVHSVMVPRVDIQAVSGDDRKAIETIFADTGRKKLPVTGRNLDDILGILYARDMLLHPSKPVQQLMRPVVYVPEVISLAQLLQHFQDTKTQLAVVVDEYGGVSGLVTLSDVLAQIVGSLDVAERPEPQNPVEQIDENTYRLAGALSVRPWRQLLGIKEQHGNVNTLGGVVISALGRIPREGDIVRFEHFAIIVDKIENRRIDRVMLKIWDSGSKANKQKDPGRQ